MEGMPCTDDDLSLKISTAVDDGVFFCVIVVQMAGARPKEGESDSPAVVAENGEWLAS